MGTVHVFGCHGLDQGGYITFNELGMGTARLIARVMRLSCPSAIDQCEIAVCDVTMLRTPWMPRQIRVPPDQCGQCEMLI